MVSFYVPGSKPVSDATNRISSELAAASNIKSKQTRDAVAGALRSILNHLKQWRVTPEHGIALFASS